MNQSHEPIRLCGWDVGGAHLKFAGLSSDLRLVASEQLICPLWQDRAHLHAAISTIHTRYQISQARHAVTMTGELCDSFITRRDGIRLITEVLNDAFESGEFSLYGLHGKWISPENLGMQILDIASANWSASAHFIASRIESAIVVDIGSTTTDIICIHDGEVRTRGVDDFSRLKYHELVYTGLVRTPIAALVDSLPYAGDKIPVVAETFATVADAHRILGNMPAHADLYPTADGEAKSVVASARRLFRMIGRDYEGEIDQARLMAAHVQECQLQSINRVIEERLREMYGNMPDTVVVGMGCGAGLVELLAQRNRLNYCAFDSFIETSEEFAKQSGDSISPSVCGPAIAVAFEYARRLKPEEAGFCVN